MVSATSEQAVSAMVDATKHPSHRGPVTPLQQLILDVHDSGFSYQALADRSQLPDGTGGVTRGRIQQLATGPVRRGLDRETREALARALHVPPSVVNDAVSQSVGTFSERGQDLDTRRLLATVQALPAEQSARWFRLAHAVADTLATEASGTQSDQLEKIPDARFGRAPLQGVTAERVDLGPEEALVVGRFGEMVKTNPAVIDALATLGRAYADLYDEAQEQG